MKSIEDRLKLMLDNAISYAYERRTNFRGAYIKIYEEILSRFAELDSALTEAVKLNTKWCEEVAELEKHLAKSQKAVECLEKMRKIFLYLDDHLNDPLVF